jgi:hypothetical protein
MRMSFIARILLCLIVVFALLSRFVVGNQAVAQRATLPANEPYSLSYAAGGHDARGNFLGGTELMNLAAFEGKLYAGIGYWMDVARFRSAPFDPRAGAGYGMGRADVFQQSADPPSGPQILVLDSKNSQWRQEMVFDQRNYGGGFLYNRLSAMELIQFHRYDAAGNVLGPAAQMLVVGLDGRGGTVYTRRLPGNWEDTRFPTPIPIRSLAVHYDRTDKTEKLFAGPGGEQDQTVDRPIYSGVYDPSAPGRIRWDPTPEHLGFQGRVMSMVECGGSLFAAARPSILRRNDAKKSWEIIYTYPVTDPLDLSIISSGFRGLTCIDGPDGKKALLTGFEGTSGDILRVDPQTGSAVVELHTRQFLTQQWGSPPAKRDIIPGYNDVPLVRSAPEIRLFGILSFSPNANQISAAWFLSRAAGNPPRYEPHEVGPPPNWPYARSDTGLWSVRSIAVSPFPEDQGQILYLGGYDGHFKPDHNTAWLYRVGMDTALAGYK